MCDWSSDVCSSDLERPADRRLGADGTPAKASRQLEADMLLSEDARLGADQVYRSNLPGCK